MKKQTTGIDDAIRAAGSQPKLARELGVTQQFIAKCKAQGWVPLARAQEIETLFGIPRSRLINPRIRDLVGAEDEL